MKKFDIIIILMVLFCILLSSSIVSAGPVSGNTFNDIQNEVNNPANGGTVDLNGGTTYIGSGNPILIQNTGPIIISGPNVSNKATLDANYRNYIFNVNSTSTITFRNINFINGNSSISPGGAIIAHSTVIIENCTFDNNYGQSGAAIMMNPAATGSNIRDCNFTNNYGIYENPVWGWGEGAAIDTHADNTIIENCIFENNYIENNGGAISSALGLNNEIINCTFINNTAGNNGGAILVRNSTIKVENSSFINNSACYGSAIFNDPDSILYIVNCTFIDNFAGTYDIIAPEYIVNTTTNATIEISLVLGDNILDAIYNDQGTVTINGTIANELESSPDQNITLTFEGVNYTVATNASGVAIFTIPTNSLTSGQDYPYTVTYNQTTLYASINKTSNITVDDTASNFGSVPGTGSNPTTGPTTNIPTAYPPTPPYNPPTTTTNKITTNNNKQTTTNNKLTTSKSSSVKSSTTIKKTASKKVIKVESKKKTKTITTIKKITYCENRKVNGKLVPYKVTANQTYKNGKKSGNPIPISREKANKTIYFENFDLTKKEKTQYKNYLKKTSNCQVNDPYIQKQVKNILGNVKGILTPEKKAKAFQKFIKNRKQYEYYRDTRYGAINGSKRLLKKGPGVDALNCADQSHLMIALLRTSGVPAIYEHGKKGIIGHYWPRALVSKDNWVKVDSTNFRHGYDYTTWSVKKYPVVRQLYSLGNNVNQCKKIPDNNVIKALNKKKYK